MTLLSHEPVNTRYWIGSVAAVVIVLLVAWFGLTGSENPMTTGATITLDGHPETLLEAPAAYLQESIIYGETDPGNPGVLTEILPVYIVESIIFGEIEAPIGR